MKNLVFLFLLISGISFSQNRVQLQLFSQFQAPIKSQMPAMNTNLGLGFSVGYKVNEFFPMFLQFEYTHSYNSNYHVNRNAIINAGYLYNYNLSYKVNYETYFNTYLIGAKFQTGTEYSLIRWFVTPQIGLASFNSKYSTVDLNNPFGNYYQQHSRYNDWDADDIVYTTNRFQHTLCFAYGLQAGLELSINELLNKSSNIDNRIVISGNFLTGSKDFSYINLDNLRMVNVGPEASGILNLPSNSSMNVTACTPVNTSRLMIWGIQIGYIFVF